MCKLQPQESQWYSLAQVGRPENQGSRGCNSQSKGRRQPTFQLSSQAEKGEFSLPLLFVLFCSKDWMTLIHTGARGGGSLLFRVHPFKCWCHLEPLLQIHLEIMFSRISGNPMIQPSIISTVTASFQTNGCFRASKGQSILENQKTLKSRSPCTLVWSAENSWALWK